MYKLISTLCVLGLLLNACGNEPKGLKARPVPSKGQKDQNKTDPNQKPEGAFYDIKRAEYRKIEENKMARKNMIYIDRSKDEFGEQDQDARVSFACKKNILEKTEDVSSILISGQSQLVIRQNIEKRSPDRDKTGFDDKKQGEKLRELVSLICMASTENFEEQLKKAEKLRYSYLIAKQVVKIDHAYINKDIKTTIRVVCLDEKSLEEVPTRLEQNSADSDKDLENYYSDIVMLKGSSILVPEEFKSPEGKKSESLVIRCQ